MVTLLLKLLRELVSINKSCPKPPFIHIKKKKNKKKNITIPLKWKFKEVLQQTFINEK